LSKEKQRGKDDQPFVSGRPNSGKKQKKENRIDKDDFHFSIVNQDGKDENRENQNHKEHTKTGVCQPIIGEFGKGFFNRPSWRLGSRLIHEEEKSKFN
jgi:hypothetical protein